MYSLTNVSVQAWTEQAQQLHANLEGGKILRPQSTLRTAGNYGIWEWEK